MVPLFLSLWRALRPVRLLIPSLAIVVPGTLNQTKAALDNNQPK